MSLFTLVIDNTGDSNRPKRWVYSAPASLIQKDCVKLDMTNKSVVVKPTAQNPSRLYYFEPWRHDLIANINPSQKVLPYFGVNSPHFKLSLVEEKSQAVAANESLQRASACNLTETAK